MNKQQLREQFEKDYVDYVNATLLHIEITQERDHINFEEEMEWIINWWLDKIC